MAGVDDVLHRGRASQVLAEAVGDAVELHQVPRHLLRQPDLAAVFGQGVEDGLAHPPGGVGEELVLPLRIEALGGFDEAQVALGDEVQQVQAHALEFPRLLHHEAQVALHQHAQAFGVAVVLPQAPVDPLLLRRQQRQIPDRIKVLVE